MNVAEESKTKGIKTDLYLCYFLFVNKKPTGEKSSNLNCKCFTTEDQPKKVGSKKR